MGLGEPLGELEATAGGTEALELGVGLALERTEGPLGAAGGPPAVVAVALSLLVLSPPLSDGSCA